MIIPKFGSTVELITDGGFDWAHPGDRLTVSAVNFKDGKIKCENPRLPNSHELFTFGPWEYRVLRENNIA